ncbi:MAG: zinc ribbon domain-containing protein [Clostridia bacterium]|nr:zinc ribbon domain-containing protein [Clostridia bacterium]
MRYSDRLNGYWEEGYHYYLEFRDEKLTVRGYRRDVTLETTVSYDADALERGERTVITLGDNILSRTWDGQPFTWIKELAYENGELKMLYFYTIMGETLYTLKKVENGPFDHIIIRDDEFLPGLQGKWVKWAESGDRSCFLTIEGNRLTLPWAPESRPFHVVSYAYDREAVHIVPENLIDEDFGSYTGVDVLPDMLTTRMIVFDASMPLWVFAREDMLDKISVPAAAKEPMRNTMIREPAPSAPFAPPAGFTGMGMTGDGKPLVRPAPENKKEPSGKGPNFCSCCGYKLPADHGKFCPECGSRL